MKVFAAQKTVDGLAYATDSGLEAACVQVRDQIPVGDFVVHGEDVSELALYRLRKQLGLKAVLSFDEFCERVTVME